MIVIIGKTYRIQLDSSIDSKVTSPLYSTLTLHLYYNIFLAIETVAFQIVEYRAKLLA